MILWTRTSPLDLSLKFSDCKVVASPVEREIPAAFDIVTAGFDISTLLVYLQTSQEWILGTPCLP